MTHLYHPRDDVARLLEMDDRVPHDEFTMTHEFLALMLGVHRQTVSAVAQEPRGQGWIAYRRGFVRIVDRTGLEGATCECYEVIRDEFARPVGPPSRGPIWRQEGQSERRRLFPFAAKADDGSASVILGRGLNGEDDRDGSAARFRSVPRQERHSVTKPARPQSRTARSAPDHDPRVDPGRPIDPGAAKLAAEHNPIKRLFLTFGPGLVTGASDDDPSGIGTYAQAGARYGYATLWTTVAMLPMMIAVQYMCAKIGLVSGRGLAPRRGS